MNARITCQGTVLVMLYSGSLENFSPPSSSSFHFVGHLEAIGTCVRIFFIVIELGGSVNIATQHKKRLPSFVAAAQEATPTFSVLMRPNHEGDTICGAGEVVVREVVVENEKAAITTQEGWRGGGGIVIILVLLPLVIRFICCPSLSFSLSPMFLQSGPRCG